MAAIITDQIRILNAKNFLAGVSTATNAYYSFIGLPNPSDIESDWDTNPPSPKDNFSEEDDYWDTMIALKKSMLQMLDKSLQEGCGHLEQLMICIVVIIVVLTLQKFLVQQIYILHHIIF